MPLDIKGKEYYTVVERMKMLIGNVSRDYSLTTEMLMLDDKKVVVKATLSFKDNVYTGLAMELIGGNFINEFSALENCETSAIGRALSSAGYFGSEFCSANELENAIKQQTTKSVSKPTNKTVEVSSIKEAAKIIDDKFGKPDNSAETTHIINFGKHKDKEWKDVPQDYVKWVADKSNVDWQRDEASAELDRRNTNGEETEDKIPF